MALQKQPKTCNTCKETKDLNAFPFRKGRNYYESICRTCKTQKHKEWALKNNFKGKYKKTSQNYYKNNKVLIMEKVEIYRKANQEKIKIRAKKYNLKKKYGITLEDKQALTIKQNGLCLICKKPGELVVDHCHQTGKVRGLLHKTCNSALGLLGDDFEIVLAAAKYLHHHKDSL